MNTPKGTPWTTSKVNNLFATLRRLSIGIEGLSNALGGSRATPKPTTSWVFTGSIDDTESFGAPVEGDARLIEVQTGGTGVFEINIKKTDGSDLTFRTFGSGVWTYESSFIEAPISEFTITNITGSAGEVAVIVNAVTKA